MNGVVFFARHAPPGKAPICFKYMTIHTFLIYIFLGRRG